MHLPTRTPLTPSNPSVGMARSMVDPWGSEIPGRKRTSTCTENVMASCSHTHGATEGDERHPRQSPKDRPVMRS